MAMIVALTLAAFAIFTIAMVVLAAQLRMWITLALAAVGGVGVALFVWGVKSAVDNSNATGTTALETYQLAGGVIGGICAIAALLVMFFSTRRSRKRNQLAASTAETQTETSAGVSS